ncbi:MAG: multicopper oxidase domain-containing protein, partial [Myxococcales bacterium]
MDESDAPELAPRGRWLIAVAVTALLAVWELLLDRLVNSAVPRAPGSLAQTLLLDAALWLPLAVLALRASQAVWRRGAFFREASAATVPTAAVAALAFGVLLVPLALLRQKAFALAATPLAAAPGSIDAVGPAVTAGAWLCSAVGSRPGGEAGFLGALAASARTALLVQAVAFPAFWAAIALARKSATRGGRWLAAAATATAAFVAGGILVAAAGPHDDGGQLLSAAPSCVPGRPIRTYEVSAIEVDIPLNRWGGHDPNGFMYVLDSALSPVRAQERAPFPDRVSIGLGRDPIQPLVLRVNAGDCLVVSFTNRIREGEAGFHVHGLSSSATRAGTAAAGDARARPGETVAYAFQIPAGGFSERTYTVQDPRDATTRGIHGLSGAIVVEPEGSIYRDPDTGAPLERSSWNAIIDVPGGHDFREFVLVYHQLGNALGVNYRSEDFRSRFAVGGIDEANAYSSYTYGDPATPILRSYLGERTVLRIVHGGGDAYYVHHLHGNAIVWRQIPRVRPSVVAFGWLDQPMLDRAAGAKKSPGTPALTTESIDRVAGAKKSPGTPSLTTESMDRDPEHMWVQIDALTFSPGYTRDARIECGAGGCQQAVGDFLYHSHVPQHAERGMWGLWRVFDTLQDDLAPIPDEEPPPRAVTSAGLLGRVIEGKKVVPAGKVRDGASEQSLEDLVEAQLPPRGEPLDARDATVWDWARLESPEGPIYLGEPEPVDRRANFGSPRPGRRL